MTLYAATTNQGKLREFIESASLADLTVEPLPDIGALPIPVEDAHTFMGNAELKARAYSLARPGLLVMADDSGLAVQALGGRPGVHSARFAEVEFGPEIEPSLADVWPAMNKDTRNNLWLLSLLEQGPASQPGRATRHARFVCALAVARDGEVLLRSEGDVDGEILTSPRGANGFGYDPLFLLPELSLSMAELAPEQKWTVSHRGRAFRNLLAELHGDFGPVQALPNG